MREEEQQFSPFWDGAMAVSGIELEKDHNNNHNNHNKDKDSKKGLDTEEVKEEEEGNKSLVLDNQGD